MMRKERKDAMFTVFLTIPTLSFSGGKTVFLDQGNWKKLHTLLKDRFDTRQELFHSEANKMVLKFRFDTIEDVFLLFTEFDIVSIEIEKICEFPMEISYSVLKGLNEKKP